MFGFVFFVALSVVGGKELTFLCSGIYYFLKLLMELFQHLNNSKYIIIFYSSWTKWLWCRYKEGHAIEHWKETQHCYSLELETQRVWDYVGDNYVHRLIQSKTDGKLVELNHYCSHGDGGCEECVADPGFSEALLNSRVEAVLFYLFLFLFIWPTVYRKVQSLILMLSTDCQRVQWAPHNPTWDPKDSKLFPCSS